MGARIGSSFLRRQEPSAFNQPIQKALDPGFRRDDEQAADSSRLSCVGVTRAGSRPARANHFIRWNANRHESLRARGHAGRLTLACTALLAVLALSSCTPISSATVDAVKLAARGRHMVPPTAAEVAARPYYQLQARSPDGSAVLVLGNVDGSRQAWYGSRHEVVFIEHGRVVQTSGLAQNLDGLQLPDDDPFARGLHTLQAPRRYRRLEDWSPGYRYGVTVEAELIPQGEETIEILGVNRRLRRVDERIEAPAVHYQAINHYWIDPRDGFIWKSEQHLAPGLWLQLVQLRPYRGDAA
jgi:hypothetical protein